MNARNCWLRLKRHSPGRRWEGYTYAWAECSKCEHRYTTNALRFVGPL